MGVRDAELLRGGGNGCPGASIGRFVGVVRRFMPAIVTAATVLFGMLCIVSTPPGHIPDIWAHVYRVDGIVNGDVLARPVDSKSLLHGTDGNVGGRVDWTWIDFSVQEYDGYDPAVVRKDTITVQDATGADVPYNNTATNSPVAYLPQLAAFALGKAFGLSAQVTYYLAECLMLAVYASFMGLAVAALPRWRILIGLVMLCPLLIRRYAFAISADSFTQATAFLLTCLVFGAMLRRVSVRYCLALSALSVCMAMCKFIYAPLVLLILFVPYMQWRMADAGDVDAARSGSPWRGPRLWICAVGVAASLIWLAVWMRLTSWFVTTPMIVSYDDMNAKKQALLGGADGMIEALGAIGTAIAHGKANLDNVPDSIAIMGFWMMTVAVAVVLAIATVRRALPGRMLVFWWCAWCVAVGIILLTYLALWLQYTPIGADVVDGMQHRYFFPLVPLLTLCAAECVAGLRSTIQSVAVPAAAVETH